MKGLAQADDLKRAFAAKMVAVAEQIPPNPTLQHITEFTRVIPHLIQSQLQLQPELSEIQQLLQQSNQDREHLQFQLSQVLEQTSQKQLQELVSTIFPSDARFTELQTHLQQTQQKILQLQSALATGGFIPGTVSAEAQTLILDNTLSDSSIITIYCLGTGPGNYKLLDGRTGDGTGGLAPDTEKRYSGIRWQVYRIGRNEYQIYCLGTGSGNSKWLDGRTGDGTVRLAPSTGEGYTGTRWALYKDSDYSYLYCLGTGAGNYKWLDGRTGNGTIRLVPSIEGEYTGTRWSPILIV